MFLVFSSTLNAVKVQKFSVAFADLNTQVHGVAALFGTSIPVGAIVVRSFIRVGTSFAGDGDSGSTIKLVFRIKLQQEMFMLQVLYQFMRQDLWKA